MRQFIAAIAVTLLASPAIGQEPSLSHIEVPETSADCSSGVAYDDGGFGDFYGLNPAWVVMKFDLPAGTTALDQVCTCLARSEGSSTTLPFDVVVYDDNGSGGSPGAFLGSVAATANGIPVVGSLDFYNVSLAGSGIVLPDTSVYVGVRFASDSHYICGDSSAGISQRAVYHSFNGTFWSGSETAFSGFGPKAWGIRVDPDSDTLACTPTAEALCLNGGRFRVVATYESPTGGSGHAVAEQLTDDTGYFWFFNDANVEVVVKVLDGCSYNDRFWVFGGGLTNVRTVISVTDTTTGMVRTYVNNQETAFEPIQDTSAFDSCP